jgi:hypothetical protein
MVPGLIGLYALRDRLEQAIAALEPVLPALAAWEASQGYPAQEAAPAPGRPPERGLPIVPTRSTGSTADCGPLRSAARPRSSRCTANERRERASDQPL